MKKTHRLKKLNGYTVFQKKYLSVVLIIFAFVVSILGTLIAAYLSQKDQDIRQQAADEENLVSISFDIPETVTLSQENTAIFSIDTNGVSLTGIQLSFDFLGSFTQPPVITANSTTTQGYQTVSSITPIESGYRVNLAVFGGFVENAAQPVILSDTQLELARLTFLPSQAGSYTITNTQQSTAIRFDNNQNALNPLSDRTFEANEVSASPTGQEPTPQPTITQELQSTPTPTQELTATQTPVPTATSAPEVGGPVYKQCGEGCNTNVECANNLMCYNGLCRRANNPNDQFCFEPPDNGISRSCNEYCADNRECASGYTCYYNRCRNPKNLDSTTCQNPTSITQINPTSRPSIYSPTATNTPTPKLTTNPTPTTVPDPYTGSKGEDQPTNIFGPADNTLQTPTTAPLFSSPTPSSMVRVTLPPTQNEVQSQLIDSATRILSILMIGAGIIIASIASLLMLTAKRRHTNHNSPHLDDTLEFTGISTPEGKVDMNKFAGQLKPKNPNDSRPRDLRDER